MTSGSATRREKQSHEALNGVRSERAHRSRRHRLVTGLWVVVALVVAGLVTAGLWSARPQQSTAVRSAADFTLPGSEGGNVHLAGLRGHPVLLYFSEGAGCDACLVQMAKIEADPGFTAAGVTVLPIVMNTADQINADRRRLAVKTPFLLDDGTVSKEYGTLGTGMHAGLPGHGFVLIDAQGDQVWKGDYPSMWIDPGTLLGLVRNHL